MSKPTLIAEFTSAVWPEPTKFRLVDAEVAGASQLLLAVSICAPRIIAYATFEEGLAQLRAREIR